MKHESASVRESVKAISAVTVVMQWASTETRIELR